MKVTHKLMLVVIVPLIVQISLLGVLKNTLEEAEKDRLAEARTVEILSYVNLVLNDCMTHAGSMIMFKMFRRPEFGDEMSEVKRNLRLHVDRLSQLAEEDTVCGEGIKEFLKVIEQAGREFDSDQSAEAGADSYGMESMKGAAKARALLHRIIRAGKIVVSKEMDIRQKYDRSQTRNRALILQIITAAAVLNVVIALLFLMLFSRGFAHRLKILMDHAVNIVISKPLGRALDGGDELAQLDSVFQRVSRELAAARQKERAVIDNAALIICSLSESLNITMINPAVKQVLNIAPDDLNGQSIQSLFHPDDKTMSYETLQNCKTSGTQALFVARLRASDGRYHFTEWAVTWSKEEKSLFCVVHDITERKEAEQLKQDVIAMVSHDLRAPLTSLSVTLDMLIEGILGDLNDNGNRMMNNAQESVQSLIVMINDLLDMERLESGAFNLNYDETKTDTLIAHAIDIVSPEASRRDLTISHSPSNATMKADGDRIGRVLVNLLSNAVKFSPRGKTITVGCQPVNEAGVGEMLEFTISDQGPGIPDEKIAMIFEKFQQAGIEPGAEKRGSGLGLAICKAIVEAHRGTLGVRSQIGEGSTFWFRVPRAET